MLCDNCKWKSVNREWSTGRVWHCAVNKKPWGEVKTCDYYEEKDGVKECLQN